MRTDDGAGPSDGAESEHGVRREGKDDPHAPALIINRYAERDATSPRACAVALRAMGLRGGWLSDCIHCLAASAAPKRAVHARRNSRVLRRWRFLREVSIFGLPPSEATRSRTARQSFIAPNRDCSSLTCAIH